MKPKPVPTRFLELEEEVDASIPKNQPKQPRRCSIPIKISNATYPTVLFNTQKLRIIEFFLCFFSFFHQPKN
jgi:hypothetical protein